MIDTVADHRAHARPRAASAWSLARGLRVHQWTKNLLLFAGLLFAAKLGDA